MEKLKEYKMIFLSGIAVLVFLAASYVIVGNAEQKDSKYTYAEHLFQDDMVNEINIEIDEVDWQDMLENPLEEEYHQANVTINGETVGNVAIRTKGNNTLTSVSNSDSDRYSLKIDFDYYEDGGNYYGLKKLCLNNNYGDSSNMREYISYEILEGMGIPTPGHAYSHITINGEEWGLFLAVEAIDEVFLATHFEDAAGDLYKPDGAGADLVYRGDDISVYTGLNLKTNEESSDGSAILALLKALDSGEGLENVLDVDEVLRYLAVNVALANYDSYLGGTTHNYYLYEQNGVFSILPWDYNYAFGIFGGGTVDIYQPANASMGGGRGARGAAETAEENIKPAPNGEMPAVGEMPTVGEMPAAENKGVGGMNSSAEKPLVDTLLEQERFLSLYESYLKEIAETYLTEAYMGSMVTEIHDLIAPYVEQDATAFYTYAEFEQACSVDPADTYSLVYYAVNMADSIQNQLAGGEPTFDTSSLQGSRNGGKGGGMPDFGGEMPERETVAEMPDFGRMPEQTEARKGAEQSADTAKPSEPAGQPAETEETKQTERNFGGRGGNGHEMPGGMGGERGAQQVDLKEYLPTIAVCGGVFGVGAMVLALFKRKKELKPPKGN